MSYVTKCHRFIHLWLLFFLFHLAVDRDFPVAWSQSEMVIIMMKRRRRRRRGHTNTNAHRRRTWGTTCRLDGISVLAEKFDWQPVSSHSVGGNKAQCHGNHIKSTLKMILLRKGRCFWWFAFLLPLVHVFTHQFNFKEKIRWDRVTLCFIRNYEKSHVQSNTCGVFMFLWCVFQFVDGFIYSIPAPPVLMYYVLRHTARGPLWVIWNEGSSLGLGDKCHLHNHVNCQTVFHAPLPGYLLTLSPKRTVGKVSYGLWA